MTKKNPVDIKPGCYVLVADVTNPRPDKRVTRNWTCAQTWKKGMRLYVRVYQHADGSLSAPAIENIDERYAHMNVQMWENNGDRWNALVANMLRVEEDLDFLIHRRGIENTYRDILRVFLKQGRVTLPDIEAAHETAINEAEAEWAAEQAAKSTEK